MLSEALRLIRVYHDVKLVDLAEALGVAVSYLSEIENKKRIPSLKLVEKYAEYFKVRPSTILFFSEELDGKGFRGKTKAALRNNIVKFLQLVEKEART